MFHSLINYSLVRPAVGPNDLPADAEGALTNIAVRGVLTLLKNTFYACSWNKEIRVLITLNS